ncbi:MAG: FlgO family outer membrane protein [Thermodesulfobacteriota bacterium]
MKKVCLLVIFLALVNVPVHASGAGNSGSSASSSHFEDIAETIAFKLDKNLITSFDRSIPVVKTNLVDIENREESSTFGRFLGEEIGDAFSRYGYRVAGEVLGGQNRTRQKGEGNSVFAARLEKNSRIDGPRAFLMGTYCQGERYVYLSVRIVSTMHKSVVSSCSARLRKDRNVAGMLQRGTNTSPGTKTSQDLGPFASGKVELDKQSSKDTKIVQKRLYKLRYYHGRIDGIWGPKTQRAMEFFKAAYNIPEPEEWDMRTQKKLFRLP